MVAVGYSQGGIHAMNLAADELFLNEYDMKYVLTAGSPVGGIVPAAGRQFPAFGAPAGLGARS